MIGAMSKTTALSRFLRWLPGRLVVAWAVLGAASAVALMYFPIVYEAQSTERLLFTTRLPWEGQVRVFGKFVYYKKSGRPGEIRGAIDGWRRWTTAGFAGVGGVLGALVGRREQRRWQRNPASACRGGRLGLVVSAVVFMFLFVAGVPGDVEWSLYQWMRWEIWLYDLSFWRGRPISSYALDVAPLPIVSVAIGWAAHVAAGARGVRLSIGRRPEQAADYADDLVDATPSAPKTT
jgi:hypothetical protein